MAGDEEEDLREDLRGFPFERRMGADTPLGSGRRGDVGLEEAEEGGEEGGEMEVALGKGTVAEGAGRGSSSREEEWSSSSSWAM